MKSFPKSAITLVAVAAMVGTVAFFATNSNSSITADDGPLASSSSSSALRRLETTIYCGCPNCDDGIWNAAAPSGSGETCGSRMESYRQTMSHLESCRKVAYEYPDICGACNTNTCEIRQTDALKHIENVGSNGEPSSAFPLGLCQGDCDNNEDCAPGLACYQRVAGESVPGCTGGESDSSDVDYCIDPYQLQSIPPQNLDHSDRSGDVFKLKIDWQPGYFWQNERIERYWCLRCSGDDLACTANSRIYNANCNIDSLVTQWKLKYHDDGSFQVKDSNSDMCLSLPEDLSLPLGVAECDGSDVHQLFKSQNGNPGFGSSFELSPVWLNDACVGVTHHPKYSEWFYAWPCGLARRWTTNAWTFY